MLTVREPAVAGLFYPADRQELAREVDQYLAAAPSPKQYSNVIIAPHAGYDYSGKFAAEAYRALDPATRRVLILGPTHYVGIEGMALAGVDLHRTPLGDVPADVELTTQLEALPSVITAPVVQAQEHSLEVHLPFLQQVLDDFTVVPLAVGRTDPDEVAQVIDVALSMPDTAVVISSDLSHYHPAWLAREMDQRTVDHILGKSTYLSGRDACGVYPVNGLMRFAQVNRWVGQTLALGNSADTAGDGQRVVGYAAIAWYKEGNYDHLLDTAREAIYAELGAAATPRAPEIPDATKGAAFVTLTVGASLRGCIGSLTARRPLNEDVAANAVNAAFSDPRFPPLTPGELGVVDIEVSVLSEPKELPTGMAEREVITELIPHRYGVVWHGGGGSATFLPQVWDSLPDPEQFLRALKLKAGVSADYWGEDVRIQVYTVEAVKGPAMPSR